MTDRPPTSLVQRIFLGWDGPALPRAAKRMAEVYAGAEGLDLRQIVVVTPAARAGRRLVEPDPRTRDAGHAGPRIAGDRRTAPPQEVDRQSAETI